MANELIPLYEPGQAITGHCVAAVVGKRFVRVSAAKQAGSTLTPSGADQVGGGNVQVDQAFTAGGPVPPFGVADRDAPIGGKVGCVKAGTVPVECSAAITAGTRVMPAADGRAAVYAPGAGPDIAASGGVALTTTTAAGQEVMVDLESKG